MANRAVDGDSLAFIRHCRHVLPLATRSALRWSLRLDIGDDVSPRAGTATTVFAEACSQEVEPMAIVGVADCQKLLSERAVGLDPRREECTSSPRSAEAKAARRVDLPVLSEKAVGLGSELEEYTPSPRSAEAKTARRIDLLTEKISTINEEQTSFAQKVELAIAELRSCFDGQLIRVDEHDGQLKLLSPFTSSLRSTSEDIYSRIEDQEKQLQRLTSKAPWIEEAFVDAAADKARAPEVESAMSFRSMHEMIERISASVVDLRTRIDGHDQRIVQVLEHDDNANAELRSRIEGQESVCQRALKELGRLTCVDEHGAQLETMSALVSTMRSSASSLRSTSEEIWSKIKDEEKQLQCFTSEEAAADEAGGMEEAVAAAAANKATAFEVESASSLPSANKMLERISASIVELRTRIDGHDQDCQRVLQVPLHDDTAIAELRSQIDGQEGLCQRALKEIGMIHERLSRFDEHGAQLETMFSPLSSSHPNKDVKRERGRRSLGNVSRTIEAAAADKVTAPDEATSTAASEPARALEEETSDKEPALELVATRSTIRGRAAANKAQSHSMGWRFTPTVMDPEALGTLEAAAAACSATLTSKADADVVPQSSPRSAVFNPLELGKQLQTNTPSRFSRKYGRRMKGTSSTDSTTVADATTRKSR